MLMLIKRIGRWIKTLFIGRFEERVYELDKALTESKKEIVSLKEALEERRRSEEEIKRAIVEFREYMGRKLDESIGKRLDKLSRFFSAAGGHKQAGKRIKAITDPQAFIQEQFELLSRGLKEVIEKELDKMVGEKLLDALKRIKGELGEVIAYSSLEKEYDFVIPVGR